MGTYYYQGLLDYSQAMKQFEIALKQSPKNSECTFWIACVHRRAGNWEKALESFKKASVLDPRSARIAQNAGQTYDLLREYGEALSYFDIAIMLRPDWNNPYDRKSRIYVKWNMNTQKARTILKEANQIITSTVEQIPLRHEMILLEIYDGNYEEALKYLLLEKSEAFQGITGFIPWYQHFAMLYG